MGPFLLYPEEAATSCVRPTLGHADHPVCYTHTRVPAPRPRYRQGHGPKVIEATMMDNVTLREAAELRVKLDLPPEQIRRAMFFESGFGWMGQHGLNYSPEAQSWTGTVTPGQLCRHPGERICLCLGRRRRWFAQRLLSGQSRLGFHDDVTKCESGGRDH